MRSFRFVAVARFGFEVAQRQVGHDAGAVACHELRNGQMDQLRSRQVEFCAEARQFLVFSLIESHRKATIADFLRSNAPIAEARREQGYVSQVAQ